MLKPSPRHFLRASSIRFAKPPPTHFTATGPHAYAPPSSKQQTSSPTFRASTVQIPNVRPGETPRERVERLRAAARQARMAELPWQEKMIETGRVWMDRVHRTFTLSLIFFAVVLGGITAYAVFDMIAFNRRKTMNYNLEKQQRNEKALATAMAACAKGTANVKQRVLVKRYEMVKESEDERVKNRGAIAKTLEWVVPGVMGRQSEARLVMKLDDDIIKSLESGELPKFLDQVQEPLGRDSPPIPVPAIQQSTGKQAPGRLDQQAEQAVTTVQSWLKWPWR